MNTLVRLRQTLGRYVVGEFGRQLAGGLVVGNQLFQPVFHLFGGGEEVMLEVFGGCLGGGYPLQGDIAPGCYLWGVLDSGGECLFAPRSVLGSESEFVS